MKTIEEKAKAYDKALERANNFIENGDEHEKTVAESIFAGLRESDDERIRKGIISVLERSGEASVILKNEGIYYEDAIAYLEKQKEDKEELVYRLNGLMQDYINEGKNDEEREHRLKCYQLFWDALEDTSYFEQKEQKPNIELIQRSWYTEGYHDREFGKEPKWTIKTGDGGPKYELNPKYGQPLADEQKPAEVEQKPLVRMLKDKKAITEDIRNGIPTKTIEKERNVKFATPVDVSHTEWSEEDEKMLEAFLHKLEVCDMLTNKEVMWAKHRLKSLSPQPKQEWSEEDKANLDNIIWLCENCEKGIENVWIPSQATQIKNLIKSLRPQSKVNSVEYERGFLAGQGSVKHWKPSEEQMDILDKIYHYLWADRNATADMQDGLGDLINELKEFYSRERT